MIDTLLEVLAFIQNLLSNQGVAIGILVAICVIVVAWLAVVLAFLILCTCWCVRRYRLASRRNSISNYLTVLTDEDIEQQKAASSTVVYDQADASTEALNVSMWLRATAFSLARPLPSIGRAAAHKHHFLLNSHSKQRYILTVVDAMPEAFLIETDKERQAIAQLLKDMQHPYLQATPEFDYFLSKAQAYAIHPYAEKGSLKDMLQGVKDPTGQWTKKYHSTPASSSGKSKRGSRGLSTHECAVYGRQILQGLKALSVIGMRYPYLSSTNIFMMPSSGSSKRHAELVCQIGDLESTFMGNQPAYANYFSPLNKKVVEEVICFGHVLFEMATGDELNAATLAPERISHLAEPLKRILTQIFDLDQVKDTVSVDSLLNEGFFTVSMNNTSLVDIADPNPVKRLKSSQQKLLSKVDLFIQSHDGLTERPSGQHKSTTMLINKRQKKQDELMAKSFHASQSSFSSPPGQGRSFGSFASPSQLNGYNNNM